MTSPLRVLQVAAPAKAGGLESVVAGLAIGLRQRSHEVTLAALLGPEDPPPFLAEIAAAGVRVVPIHTGTRAYLRQRRLALELARSCRADVVHTHGYQADVVVGRAAASAGLPTVSTVHGFTGGDFKNRLYEFLQLRAFRRMSAVIAVSLPLCDRLRGAGVPAGRLHLVRNAWSSPAPPLTRSEARTLLGLPAADPIVGWIGRLSPEKGPEVFVEALGRCRWRASVMGDGRSGPALRQQAASLGIGERIRWHGLVGAAGRLVTAFDILVLSSHTEGTPIVLFEAMEAGVPIVATAVGGVPDVLGSEEALLVAPGQPEALAAAIDAAMGDRAAAAHRAARARQRLHSEFASGPWLARHEALYRSLLPVTGSRA